MDTRWQIQLLGRLSARRGEHEVAHFARQKAGDLLAYLALTYSVGTRSRHPHPREALVELLWPETDPELGRQYFRNVLHALREQLAPGDCPGAPLLLTDRTRVGLRPDTFSTDVGEFSAALAAARAAPAGEAAPHLAAAVAAYGGVLLPDSSESWVLTEQEALREQYLEALRQLVAALEAAGDLPGALERARQAVAADPLREESHYDLMRLYAATGQPSACLRQYQELERLLREELDETPSAEARALAEELRASARILVVVRRPPRQDGATGGRGEGTRIGSPSPPHAPSPRP